MINRSEIYVSISDIDTFLVLLTWIVACSSAFDL